MPGSSWARPASEVAPASSSCCEDTTLAWNGDLASGTSPKPPTVALPTVRALTVTVCSGCACAAAPSAQASAQAERGKRVKCGRLKRDVRRKAESEAIDALQ